LVAVLPLRSPSNPAKIGSFTRMFSRSVWNPSAATLTALVALVLAWAGPLAAQGDTVPKPAKHVIGSTATISEVSSGLPFAARIDTGAKSCSLHVEKWEIKDPEKKAVDNIGKSIRFLIKNDDGESEWIETLVAGRVRIKSSVHKDGNSQGRYKVRLTLQWKDVRKEVLVTLTDRNDMQYPLLIGRNFLRGDFLVDVEQDSDD
jgi:hypothetical protein